MNLLIALIASAQASCTPRDLVQLEREARDKLFDGDFEAALEPVRQAEDSLGCPLDFLVPGQTSGLFQAGSAAALALGQEALASRWYELAHRLAPAEPFDRDLAGPEGAVLFEEAGQRLLGVGHGRVHARSHVRVDGWALLPGQERELLPGPHVVQFLGEDGGLHSELIDLMVGSELPVGPRQAPPLGRLALGGGLTTLGLVALNGAYQGAFATGSAQFNGTGAEELQRQAAVTNLLFTGGVVLVVGGAGVMGSGMVSP